MTVKNELELVIKNMIMTEMCKEHEDKKDQSYRILASDAQLKAQSLSFKVKDLEAEIKNMLDQDAREQCEATDLNNELVEICVKQKAQLVKAEAVIAFYADMSNWNTDYSMDGEMKIRWIISGSDLYEQNDSVKYGGKLARKYMGEK